MDEDQIEVLGDHAECGKPSVEHKGSHRVTSQMKKNIATSEYCVQSEYKQLSPVYKAGFRP